MTSPLTPGRIYDVYFDTSRHLDLTFVDSLDGFLIFTQQAEASDDPGEVTLSDAGIADPPPERVFFNRGFVRHIREHGGATAAPTPDLEQPRPAEAVTDSDEEGPCAS